MKIELCFAELHTPLFLGGTNWGHKLDAMKNSKGKITLFYDRAEKELIVGAAGRIAIIPTSNVVSMTPIEIAEIDALAEKIKEAQVELGKPTIYNKPGPKPKAQVSGPHDHVFAQGPGKVRD